MDCMSSSLLTSLGMDLEHNALIYTINYYINRQMTVRQINDRYIIHGEEEIGIGTFSLKSCKYFEVLQILLLSAE